MWSSQSTDILLVRMQNGSTALENMLAVFFKLNIYSPYNSTIPPLGIYQRDMKT